LIVAIRISIKKIEIDQMLQNYYNKSTIDSSYNQLLSRTNLDNYYNKLQIDSSFAQVYTKTQVDTSLNNYATKIYLDSSLNTNYATKVYLDSSINNYALKSYVDSSLNTTYDPVYTGVAWGPNIAGFGQYLIPVTGGNINTDLWPLQSYIVPYDNNGASGTTGRFRVITTTNAGTYGFSYWASNTHYPISTEGSWVATFDIWV
jgi:hypothetical protein